MTARFGKKGLHVGNDVPGGAGALTKRRHGPLSHLVQTFTGTVMSLRELTLLSGLKRYKSRVSPYHLKFRPLNLAAAPVKYSFSEIQKLRTCVRCWQQ